jgi:hypothetical protein
LVDKWVVNLVAELVERKEKKLVGCSVHKMAGK